MQLGREALAGQFVCLAQLGRKRLETPLILQQRLGPLLTLGNIHKREHEVGRAAVFRDGKGGASTSSTTPSLR